VEQPVQQSAATNRAAVPDDRITAAWSRYWAAGILHSCPKAFPGNYGGEIHALWAGFFGPLAAGSRVLDIGTGNGAVALIARDVTAQAGCAVEIEAIDIAAIDPARAARTLGLSLAGINFRGGVAAESTGYPECWFDAVAGHYALEHTQVEATLAELARIVKPGGETLFVIHHAGSVAMTTTRTELEHFDFLEHEVPVIVHARRFLKRLATATRMQDLRRMANDATSREQLDEIRRMARQVGDRAKSRAHAMFIGQIAVQVITAIQESAAVGPTVALGKLNTLGEEVTAARDRMRSIVRAAHAPADMQRLSRAFQRAGFVPQPEQELALGGKDLIGWTLRAMRS
jgi:ubiquinone/menaquinone biosynthesis C-methylase UbiE